MIPASSSSLSDNIDLLPLACLYAEEETFIYPLREYLESHGCQVLVNSDPPISETYSIISGSPNFVKGIFATKRIQALRVLGIVITSEPSDGQMLTSDSRKIVVINPRYLQESDVEEIFSFFFSSSEQLLNITRNIHEQTAPFVAAPSDAPVEAVVTNNSENSIEKRTDIENENTAKRDDLLSKKDTERIAHIMIDVFGDHTNLAKKKTMVLQRKKIVHAVSSFLILCIFLGGIVLFPLVTYFGSLSASSFFMMRAANYIGKTDISYAERSLTTGIYWLSQTTFMFSLAKAPISLVGLGEIVRGQERLLSLLSDVSLGIDESIDVVKQGKIFIQASVPSSVREDEKLPASTIEGLRISVVAAHNSLGLAEAELSILLRDKTFPFSLPVASSKFETVLSKIRSVRNVLSYAEELLTVYPKIAGFKTPQSYLILLQNSNELRPTGGFIGSVGLATFEEGSFSDFVIEDVYALDGQLKGHVDPPAPISQLLNNEHWYLRDSNWDPDFKVSAERALWFYEKETGKRVDGVIAINVPIVVTLLKAIGPIQLPDYNDRITADNFFGKSLYYTQSNFFPGSTQKRDFLGSLARASMTKIMTDRDIDAMAVLKSLMQGIESRDILVQFQNADVQTMVEHFGWGGRVYTDPLCRGVDMHRCMADQVLISEANVSVSKVNYFVNHEAKREVTITPQGELNERISYTIGNTVNTQSDPNEKGIGGPYQTYIRFILPKDSIVNTVSIDGIAVASRNAASKTLPPLPYIENADTVQTSRSIGVALRVLPGERKELQITYTRGMSLPFGKGGAYLDLLWYKHPGLSGIPLQTIIHYPIYWSATNESDSVGNSQGSFIAKEGELQYNTQIERDTNYRIKFIQ